MRDCDLTFLSERFRLDWINSTSFLFYANPSRSGILSCGVSQEQLRLSGFGVNSLDPGCVLTVAGITFISAVAPRVRVQQVVTLFSGNFSFSNDIEALNRSLSKALEDFDKIDYNAPLRGGEELRHLQPLVPETSHLWAVWVGIMGLVGDGGCSLMHKMLLEEDSKASRFIIRVIYKCNIASAWQRDTTLLQSVPWAVANFYRLSRLYSDAADMY